MNYFQPELFDLSDPEIFAPIRPKRKKKQIDYEGIYRDLFLKGPVTFKQIEEYTGVSHNSVAQVITTLCLRYPIYDIKRGVYKLCEESDYTSVKWENLE